ncbi:MAG: cation transporter [Kiloniellales bacterium]
MKRIVVVIALLASLLAGGASAQEVGRTVKLKVDNLWCASCNYIVRQALIRTPGVLEAKFIARTDIVVTYDPTKADPQTLIAATTNYGFPSQVLVQ